MHRFRKLLRDEDGATAVLFALVLPIMLAMLGYGSEVVVMTGADRELQRTADATALAAAAQTPLADFGAIQGYPLAQQLLSGLLAPSDTVQDAGCPIGDAAAQASTLLGAFTTDAIGPPSCANGGITLSRDSDVATILFELELFLQALTGAVPVIGPLLGDPVALALVLLTQLGLPIDLVGLLPALTTPQVTATVASEVSTPFRQLITDSAGSDLVAEATARRRFKNVLLLPILSTCDPLAAAVPLNPAVINLLTDLLGGSALASLLDQLGLLDLESLRTPLLDTLPLLERLTVQTLGLLGLIDYFGGLTGVIATLGLSQVLGTVIPGSTLPLDAAPGLVGGTSPSGAPDVLDQVVAASSGLPDLADDLLGQAGLLGAATGSGCTVNVNQLLLEPVTGTAFAALDALIAIVRALPVPGIDHLANALDLLTLDLRDLLDAGSEAPTPAQILQAAADADEDVLVVLVGSTQIPLLDAFVAPGQSLQTLLDGTSNPSPGQLMTDLSAVAVDVANARGAFRAELIR